MTARCFTPALAFAVVSVLSLQSAVCAQADSPRAFTIKLLLVESAPAAARRYASPEALVRAGGRTIFSPTVSTLEDIPARIAATTTVPGTVGSGTSERSGDGPTVNVGFSVTLVPHPDRNGSIHLSLDVASSQLSAGGVPAVTTHRLVGGRLLKDGHTVSFGGWRQGANTVTVFASASRRMPQGN